MGDNNITNLNIKKKPAPKEMDSPIKKRLKRLSTLQISS